MDVNFNVEIDKDTLTPLCELFTGGCSWLVNVFFAGSVAQNCYIEEIKKSNLSSDVKAVLIANADSFIRESKNKVGILKKAREYISSKSDLSKIDKDWVYTFADKCKNVSKDEVQDIWARLLAGEINSPGSISLRTLDCLQHFSADEAKLFQRMTKYVTGGEGLLSDEVVKQFGDVGYEDYISLADCGIINSLNAATLTIEGTMRVLVDLDDYVIVADCGKESCMKLELSCYPLTVAGRQLYHIARAVNGIEQYRNFVIALRNMYPQYCFGLYYVQPRQSGITFDREKSLF